MDLSAPPVPPPAPPAKLSPVPPPDSTPPVSASAAASAYTATVVGERPMSAASALTVRDQDLRLRPIQRVGDLLRVMPGLLTVQHAGGGKANQYLLRGFDADHGTDIAMSLDGVPINMVSHAHGQGYADTSFIIPEMIDRVEVWKGPYFLEWGDLATAGAINLVSKKSFAQNFVSFSADSLQGLRALAVASPELGRVRALFMGEVSHTDGPFLNKESFNKYNIFTKLSYDLTPTTTLSLAASSYGGDWNASGQIPSRAVADGSLDFFGSVDPTEGGNSSRHNVYLSLSSRPDPRNEVSALVYWSLYTFRLYSNFTLYARDPVHGDQIEQGDQRQIGGLRASYRRRYQWRWLTADTTLGLSVRHDDIHNSLYYTEARERLTPVADHDIRETSLGLYLKEELRLSRFVRLIGGARADLFVFDVNDRREDLATTGNRTSGTRGAMRISPKATLVVSPHRTTDLYLNFGYGFHSNDARGVVRGVDPVTPLTGALGYEIGARTRLWDRLDLAASFWGLDLDSELVWVGDEGRTEESGATRRLGFEFEGRARLLPWLFLDADVTVNDARFTQNAGNGDAVALAPRVTAAAGVSVQTRFGLRGALRFTGIADRPATEDEFLQARGFYLLDAFAAYRYRFLEVGLSIENLTDQRYRSAQFATTSRLRTEAPTGAPPPPSACPAGTRAQVDEAKNFAGCEDVNFTPGYPLTVRGTLSLYF